MTIADNIRQILQDIRQAETQFDRAQNSVRLIAVSKTQPVEKLKEAIQAGQKDFGENYLQEALGKISELRRYPLEWHFIGAIQANKTREIAENFNWVHSVSRFQIAERLHRQRPGDLPPLNICLQVNISEEESKSGVNLAELLALALAIQPLGRLRLRGLMAIPAPSKNFDEQRTVYEKLAQAQQLLISKGLSLDTLSMGMTDDKMAAIAAGSTMVRVGTGIFGSRQA